MPLSSDPVASTGPPRWTEWAAWCAVASVLPSGVWRVLVGLGVDLGWSDKQLRSQDIPGGGTVYVIGLSVGSVACAALTFGLIRPWGEVFPGWLPVVGRRRVPPPLVVVVATAGTAAVLMIVVLSISNWGQVSGFAEDPDSGWARLMIACYAPAALWPPCLLAVTANFYQRRRHEPSGTSRDLSRWPAD